MELHYESLYIVLCIGCIWFKQLVQSLRFQMWKFQTQLGHWYLEYSSRNYLGMYGQHWFRQWLLTIRQQAVTWTKMHLSLLGHSESISVTAQNIPPLEGKNTDTVLCSAWPVLAWSIYINIIFTMWSHQQPSKFHRQQSVDKLKMMLHCTTHVHCGISCIYIYK